MTESEGAGDGVCLSKQAWLRKAAGGEVVSFVIKSHSSGQTKDVEGEKADAPAELSL